jgi:hypothetical protein
MIDANVRLPKVIPPRSRVRLVKADRHTPTWRKDVGRRFRVGYYSRKDGLDCVWLVNEDGEYEQSTDRESLLKYFEIERLSHEKGTTAQRIARFDSTSQTTDAPTTVAIIASGKCMTNGSTTA